MALARSQGFVAEKGGRSVDPDLVDILERATARFEAETGMRVEAFSGIASRASTTNHPNGRAIDVLIFDQNGKPIPNYQSADGWPAYSTLALIVRDVQQQFYPDRSDDLLWGGGFGGRYGTDLMHFDMSGQVKGHGMGRVPWEAVNPSRVPDHVARMGAGTIIYARAPGETYRIGGRDTQTIARVFGPPGEIPAGPRMLPTMVGTMRSPGEAPPAMRAFVSDEGRPLSVDEIMNSVRGDAARPAGRDFRSAGNLFDEGDTSGRDLSAPAPANVPIASETDGPRRVTTETVAAAPRVMSVAELERTRADQRPGAMMRSPEARPSMRDGAREPSRPTLEFERDGRGGFRMSAGGKSAAAAAPVPRERPPTPQQPAPVPRPAPRAADTETARFASDRAVLARGRGADPDSVRALQTYLNQAINADLKVDGKFGPKTERALMVFQAKAGLQVDGRAGPQTRPALVAASMGMPRPSPNPARGPVDDLRTVSVGVPRPAAVFQRPGGSGVADSVSGQPRFDYSRITPNVIGSLMVDEANRATDRRLGEIMGERQSAAAVAGRSDGLVGRLSPEYTASYAATRPNIDLASKAAGSQKGGEADRIPVARNPMAAPYELTRETKPTAGDTKATSPAWVPGTPNFVPDFRGPATPQVSILSDPRDRAMADQLAALMNGDQPVIGSANARYAALEGDTATDAGGGRGRLDTGRFDAAGPAPSKPTMALDDPRSWIPAAPARPSILDPTLGTKGVPMSPPGRSWDLNRVTTTPQATRGASPMERVRDAVERAIAGPAGAGRGGGMTAPLQSERFAPAIPAAARGLTDIVPHSRGLAAFDYVTGKDAGGRGVTAYDAGGRSFAFYQGNSPGAYAGADSREYGAPVVSYTPPGGGNAGGALLDALASIFGGR